MKDKGLDHVTELIANAVTLYPDPEFTSWAIRWASGQRTVAGAEQMRLHLWATEAPIEAQEAAEEAARIAMA